jgi:hypothetical protein
MANFHTHIAAAAAGSGFLSVLCLQVGLAGPREALVLALMGTIGGILPDIDLEHAYPSRIMFSLFGIMAAFLVVFLAENDLSIVELWLVGLIVFMVIRWPIWMVFNQYTHHRGSIHSLAGALLFTFAGVIFSHLIMGKNPFIAWLNGLFIFMGFILHLLLDELYSVDFMNSKVKRSFGTALKILDTRKREKATAMVCTLLIVWALTPDSRAFWDTLFSPATYRIIAARMLPH